MKDPLERVEDAIKELKAAARDLYGVGGYEDIRANLEQTLYDLESQYALDDAEAEAEYEREMDGLRRQYNRDAWRGVYYGG